MRLWGQLSLVDPATLIQIEMYLFHDHALVLLIGILIFVSVISVGMLLSKFRDRTIHEAQVLETIWTLVPACLLVWLALPRMRLLYLLDERRDSRIILKATGHQWYWRYELPFLFNERFDSYIIPDRSLDNGQYRLLDVDKRAIVPYNQDITVITTSSDVIHAWALPSRGVKMDAIPGRLNSIRMNLISPGVYYGQCSEICGANHSFMPIVVEAVSTLDYVSLSS